jgi:hypothetical protein
MDTDSGSHFCLWLNCFSPSAGLSHVWTEHVGIYLCSRAPSSWPLRVATLTTQSSWSPLYTGEALGWAPRPKLPPLLPESRDQLFPNFS